jgi:amino acid permease
MSLSFFENYLVVLGTLLMGFILLILVGGCLLGLAYTIQYYFGEEAAEKYCMCMGFILFCMCVAAFIDATTTEELSWKTYFPILETVVLVLVGMIIICVCGGTTHDYIRNQYGSDAAKNYCVCIQILMWIMAYALFITIIQQQPTESPTMSPTKFYLRSETNSTRI